MLFQAALSAIFILAATQGDTVKGAYLKLVNATLIVYFLPYMYMFASAIRLRAEIARQPGGRSRFPGGAARQPLLERPRLPDDASSRSSSPSSRRPTRTDKTGFFVQVFVGSFGFLGAGFVLYALAERRRRRAEAAAAA